MPSPGNIRLAGGDVADLRLLGGRPCLDFCNTVDPREGPDAHDYLSSYQALVAWAHRAGLIGGAEVLRLGQSARARSPEADAALAQALELREALYVIFCAVTAGKRAREGDLDSFNRALSAANARARLVQAQRGFRILLGDGSELERPVWLVAESAADLLTSEELERVGKCSGRECGWLFLDASKNRSRRWCSMDGCGSRAKMRRLYRRRRAEQASGPSPS